MLKCSTNSRAKDAPFSNFLWLEGEFWIMSSGPTFIDYCLHCFSFQRLVPCCRRRSGMSTFYKYILYCTLFAVGQQWVWCPLCTCEFRETLCTVFFAEAQLFSPLISKTSNTWILFSKIATSGTGSFYIRILRFLNLFGTQAFYVQISP